MKKLLWIAITILTAEILGIIGYYWINEGYAGDISLTVSRYVGLTPITSVLFLIGNIIISVIAVLYMVDSGIKKFSWRFGYGMFALCLMMLSICPHTPEGEQLIFMHRFFAAGLFLALALIAFVTTSLTKSKLARGFCYLYVLYGFHFLIARLNNLPYLMDSILIWETAYLYGGFIVMVLPSGSNKKK